MNWHNQKCSGIVCSCSTERGIRERENEMSGIVDVYKRQLYGSAVSRKATDSV